MLNGTHEQGFDQGYTQTSPVGHTNFYQSSDPPY